MSDDQLTSQQEVELKENDLLSEWLGELRFTARLLSDIDEALALLAVKRTTLEEKIISKELHSLASMYSRVLVIAHSKLADAANPGVEPLEKLRTTNFRVHEQIDQLLKALRYNLNYVEQYFEFNFCARLTQDYKFVDEIQDVVRILES